MSPHQLNAISCSPVRSCHGVCGLWLLVAGCQLEVEPEASTLRGPSQPVAATESAQLARAAAGSAAPPDRPVEAGAPAPAPAQPQAASTSGESNPTAGAGAPAAPPPAPSLPSASSDARAATPPAGAAATPPPAASVARPAANGCRPGVYVGTFNGSLELVQFAALSSISGAIRAELSPDGPQALVLKNARLVGVDQDDNAISANLTGRLNCSTHELENGKLESGTYRMKALGDAPFRGDTTAKHVDDPPSAVGTWRATADNLMFFGGRGTWNLVLDEANAQ